MPRGRRPAVDAGQRGGRRRPRVGAVEARGPAAGPPSPTGAPRRHGPARREPARGRSAAPGAQPGRRVLGQQVGGLAGELDDVDRPCRRAARRWPTAMQQARALRRRAASAGSRASCSPDERAPADGWPRRRRRRRRRRRARPGRRRRVRRRGVGQQLEGGLVVAGPPRRGRRPPSPRRRPGCWRGARWRGRGRPGRAGPARRRCRRPRRCASASAYAACSRTRSPGQQVVVDRLGEQRVPEGVGVGADRTSTLRSTASRSARSSSVGVEAGDGGEQRVGDPAAGDAAARTTWRGRASSSRSRRTSSRSARSSGRPGRLGPGSGADQLLDEERVALGAVDDAC